MRADPTYRPITVEQFRSATMIFGIPTLRCFAAIQKAPERDQDRAPSSRDTIVFVDPENERIRVVQRPGPTVSHDAIFRRD